MIKELTYYCHSSAALLSNVVLSQFLGYLLLPRCIYQYKLKRQPEWAAPLCFVITIASGGGKPVILSDPGAVPSGITCRPSSFILGNRSAGSGSGDVPERSASRFPCTGRWACYLPLITTNCAVLGVATDKRTEQVTACAQSVVSGCWYSSSAIPSPSFILSRNP